MTDGVTDDVPAPAVNRFRQLAPILGIALVILALIALASRADLSDLSQDAQDRDQLDDLREPPEGAGESGSFDPRFPPDGRIDLGGGESLELREIPGCPGGFQVGENVLIIPDPEACGFRPLEPGERAVDSGWIILSPDPDGDIGGFNIGPDGSVELLPPGEVGLGDYYITQFPDGNFGLVRPDGSIVEIFPGGGSGDLRTEDPGFNDPNLTLPDRPDPQLELPDDPDDEADDDGEGFDFSTPLLIVLAIVGVLVLGLILYSLLNGRDDKDDDVEEDLDEELQDDIDETAIDDQRGPVHFAEELSALDRLLWEIDQEQDPRRAIRRVYAALETGLDNPAMARNMSETPGIYLRRVLGHSEELNTPLRELTHLFEMARFSNHQITHEMRNQAVTNLLAIRSHYATGAHVTPELGAT